MDGSDIGNAMRTAVQANINTKTEAKLGWIIKDASNFPTVADVANQIVDERAWAALVGNSCTPFLIRQAALLYPTTQYPETLHRN
jgi:hypothetical protein